MNIWSNRRVRYVTCAVGVTAIAVPTALVVATTNSVASPSQAQAAATAPIATSTRSAVKTLPPRVLLTSSQLGSGWQVIDKAKLKQLAKSKAGTADPAKLRALLGDVAVSPSSCSDLLTVPNSDNVTGVAARAFQKGNSMFGPYAGQAVVRFADVASASAAMDKVRAVAAACSDVTITTKYGPIAGVVTPVAVPSVGADRVGYKIDANVAGFVSADAQVSVVRKGTRVIMVGQIGTAPKAALTKSMTRKAVVKA